MRPRLYRLSLLASLAACSFGQSFTGTILGTVKDASGAVVPNAQIAVVNLGTNARTAVASNESGNYTVPLLPVGRYRVEASAAGFKRTVQDGVTLQVEQQARVDLLMSVGEVAESVVVEATAPLIESTTASIGKVVDNRRIVNLPLNTRNVYSLVFLTPGVAGSVGNSYGDMRYSVNGARARMLDTLVDGISASHATVTGFSGISVFPSVDAIEEFKVQGATYSAEFGRSMGSVLNVVFKSGTNRFHGSAYEFLRNSVLDANNFFDNARGTKLASFKRSQFGGVLSGPVVLPRLYDGTNRTFFMVSFEALRERGFANRTFTVPTELERRGDFSRTFASNGQLVQVFDPFTTRANPNGAGFVRDAFPNNVIPSNRVNPVAANAVRYFPLPNTPGNAVTNQNNYSQSGSRQLNVTQSDYRIDQVISPVQRVFARYSTRLNENVPLTSFPADLAVAEGRIVEEDHVHGGVADYTRTLSPTTILNARLGFARTLYVYNNQSLGFQPSSLGLPRSLDTAVDRFLFPRFAPSGYVSLGGGDHRNNAFMSYTGLANLTKVAGNHTLKAGWETRMLRVNVSEARSAGDFSFGAGFTQGPDPNRTGSTVGNGLASLLLGAGTGSLIQGFKNVAVQSFYHALYLQDDWRVTPRLSLNLGLRWDIDTPRTERFDRTNYFDPNAPSPLASAIPGLRGGLVFVGRDGRPRTQFPADNNNFAPRFGLAYRLTPKTAIRAGYAHLYGASHQAANGTIGTQGFRRDHTWVSSLDGFTPVSLLDNPFPQGFPPAPEASAGLLTQLGQSIEAVTQDTVAPWTRQVSVSLQRELPGQMMVEAAYIHTRGFHLYRNQEGGLNLNQLAPEHMALGIRLNELVDNPFFGLPGTAGTLIGSRQVARRQLLRPYPQFGDIVPLFSSGASSFYHSLQVTVSKRYSGGLQFEGSYTLAKNIDDGDTHQNSYDIRADRALASIDLRHRLVAGYVYELPFGRGRRFGTNWSRPMDLLLGQWQVNGITTFQSGTPLSVSGGGNAGIFNPTTRPNNNGQSARLDGPVHERLNRYFDPTVFSPAPAYTFGNVGARLPDVRTDGLHNFDLSLFKDFVLTERLRVQFRAEALNAFNTPQFGSPNTNITSRDVGVVTSQANAPRQMQFGLKVLF